MASGDVFLGVADRFRDVRSALNSLSDTVFFPTAPDQVERILRQVTDDFNAVRDDRTRPPPGRRGTESHGERSRSLGLSVVPAHSREN
jgi:hypothetical protein